MGKTSGSGAGGTRVTETLEAATDRPAPATALWARGFRPFFLLAGAHGVLFMLAWLAILVGWLEAPGWLTPFAWHAHEMLFGFVAAAIAGFLLTSVPVWTGAPPVAGWRLAALAALWVAGRAVMIAASWLPPAVAAVLDGAFLFALALAIGRPILAARQLRNAGFPIVVLGLGVANALVHVGAVGNDPSLASRGMRLGVHGIALLIVLVGGRITPLFTANALRRAGSEAVVRSRPVLGRLAAAGVAALALVDLSRPGSTLGGVLAVASGALVLLRLSGWQSLRTGSDALLWSLHLGWAWTGVGLVALGASALSGAIPATVGVHVLTAGAFGATILAVMSRVALGHTGRPLAAPSGMAAAYGLVSGAALVRVVAPIACQDWGLGAWIASGLLWSAAFALFLSRFASVLVRPRIDGRPG